MQSTISKYRVIAMVLNFLLSTFSFYSIIIIIFKKKNENFYNDKSSNLFFKLLFLECLFGFSSIMNLTLLIVYFLKKMINSMYWLLFLTNVFNLIYIELSFNNSNDFENLEREYVLQFNKFYLLMTIPFIVDFITTLNNDKKEN